MRKLSVLLLASVVAGFAYVAWPIHTALQIRDAIRDSDTSTLARKIEWDSLRASIKASVSPEALAQMETETDAPKPSMWQRIKATVAPTISGTVIDRYVTPENLPWFLGHRKTYHRYVAPITGRTEPPTALAGTWLGDTGLDRFATFWRRVRSATFHSPTLFRLDVEDKYKPEKRYISTLELRGLEWKLTTLTIIGGL